MLDISKLKKVDPNTANLKLIVPKNKGIYFWCKNYTDEIVKISPIFADDLQAPFFSPSESAGEPNYETAVSPK